jgi:hypothetical protein
LGGGWISPVYRIANILPLQNSANLRLCGVKKDAQLTVRLSSETKAAIGRAAAEYHCGFKIDSATGKTWMSIGVVGRTNMPAGGELGFVEIPDKDCYQIDPMNQITELSTVQTRHTTA